MGAADKHKDVFRQEAAELLADLETSLLELEERPGDRELVGRVFRAMHTIKGSGAMFGFEKTAKFTHELETAFDAVRDGRLEAGRELIDAALKARDLIKAMIDGPGEAADEGEKEEVLRTLRRLLPPEQARPEPAVRRAGAPAAAAGEDRVYRVVFKPSPDIFKKGVDPLLLLQELSALGPATVVAQTGAVPCLDDLDPEACYFSWDILLTTNRGLNAVKDVFVFVEDDSTVNIEAVGPAADTGARKKLGDILVDRGAVTPGAVQRGLAAQKRVGQILVEMGAVDPDMVASALAEQEHVRQVQEKRRKEEAALSVRVPAAKLDRLVDLVGELVTVQAQLSQTATAGKKSGYRASALLSIAETVARLTAELRDNAMSIRMLPIGTTFGKFKRLVRDLSTELGKEIELETEGAETELDKTVIERLGDPLVHLIRNSIDHGIEPPGERERAGKPRQGAIRLSAVHSGANVLVRVADDGAGLDRDAILAKAAEQGLASRDEALTDEEVYSLVFAPGFSTAKKLTSLSGRGVGMDVVKKSVEALRGSIEIASERGKGTVITLRLPLTLAIIDGFLTRVGAEYFVFPLSVVEECVELANDAGGPARRPLANVRGAVVPYIRLREQFALGANSSAVEQIVITRVDDRRVGFVVDAVIGGHQTVIKNLGRFYRDVEGISGATILGSGTVALIVDVPRLVQVVEREPALRPGGLADKS